MIDQIHHGNTHELMADIAGIMLRCIMGSQLGVGGEKLVLRKLEGVRS